MQNRFFYFLFGILTVVVACNSKSQSKITEHFDSVRDSTVLVQLGERLFFDTQLSLDGTVSCGTCHLPELAFTQGTPKSIGIYERVGVRNVPTILNLNGMKHFMFEGHIPTIEQQMLVPLQDSLEMGMNLEELLEKLNENQNYLELSQKAFGKEMDIIVLSRSITAYVNSLVSNNSRFDQWLSGDSSALNSNEVRGWEIFSDELNCVKCHTYPNFTNNSVQFNGFKDPNDLGLFKVSGDSTDINSFKVPSLRNIELTAPYFHNGVLGSIEEVLKHYASVNYLQNEKIELSSDEISQLSAFLNSLTDTSYLKIHQ